MNEELPQIAQTETHTDGTLWVKCIAEEPKPDRKWRGMNVYHGDAKVDFSSRDGGDDHYTCPHCQKSWWVEYD